MINLMALRPSHWDKLADELATPATQESFLSGLKEYLSSTAPDDGVDLDRIYVTAVKTENAGAWRHISEDRLLDILGSVDQRVVSTFLSGLSCALRERLLSQLG